MLRLGGPNDDESLSIIIPDASDSSLKNNYYTKVIFTECNIAGPLLPWIT